MIGKKVCSPIAEIPIATPFPSDPITMQTVHLLFGLNRVVVYPRFVHNHETWMKRLGIPLKQRDPSLEDVTWSFFF